MSQQGIGLRNLAKIPVGVTTSDFAIGNGEAGWGCGG